MAQDYVFRNEGNMMYQILNVQVRLTRAAIILRSHQLWFDELFVSLLGGPSMAHPASLPVGDFLQ